MKFPWVSRKRLKKAQAEARKIRSEIDLIKWYLQRVGIELPSSTTISVMAINEIRSANPRKSGTLTDIY